MAAVGNPPGPDHGHLLDGVATPQPDTWGINVFIYQVALVSFLLFIASLTLTLLRFGSCFERSTHGVVALVLEIAGFAGTGFGCWLISRLLRGRWI
jgi:hypothetical protein